MNWNRLPATLLLVVAMSSLAWSAEPVKPAVTQHDVQAILLRHCTVCHGRRHQEGGLSLLDRKSLLKGGKSGPAVIVKTGTAAQQAAALKAAQARFDAAKKRLLGQVTELANRLKKQFPSGKPEPASLGLIAHFPLDGLAAQIVKNTHSKKDAVFFGPGALRTTSGQDSQNGTHKTGALLLDGTGQHLDAGQVADFQSDQPFTCSAWIKPANKAGAILTRIDENKDFRGIDFTNNHGLVEVHLVDKWPVNAIKVAPETVRISTDQWHHVLFSYDGSRKASGVKIYIDGVETKLTIFFDTLTGDFSIPEPWRIGRRKSSACYEGSLDEVRIYSRVLTDPEVMLLANDNDQL
ncbi:MAG: LamG-like jellyroll fold domain-containing protein, partial [Planctomycetota bacterium]|nr:LamG-like jellyroll fold domain-containing protein [Planctomycetota bacterium]